MKLHTVEATVHKPIGSGYRVKVSVIDLGIYINGMVVYPPDTEHEDWSVLTPARPAGRGKYARIVEFNKKLALWEHVYDACVDAVKLYTDEGREAIAEDIEDWSEEEYEKQLNKAFPD